MYDDSIKLTDALERRLLERELANYPALDTSALARDLFDEVLRAAIAAVGGVLKVLRRVRDSRVVYCEG